MKMEDLAVLAVAAAAAYLVYKATGGKLSLSSWVPWNKVATYENWEYFNDGTSGVAVEYAADGQPKAYYLNGEKIWYRAGA